MDVQSIMSMTPVQQMYQGTMMSSLLPSSSAAADADSLQISQQASLFSAVQELDQEDREAILDFIDGLRDSAAAGDFDAAEAAAAAPDALTALAEENGLDLEELVSQLAQGPQSGRASMPPPPPPPMQGGGMSGLTEEEEEDVQSYWQQLLESMQSGTFDAASAAEEAPEVLQTFAEENGLDLEEMLTGMAEDMEERQSMMPPPPPPPSTGYTADGSGVSGPGRTAASVLLQALAGAQDTGLESWELPESSL